MNEANHERALPLSLLAEGERARILLFRGGRQLETRLIALGLNTGSVIKVLNRTGGGVVLLRGETRLALGAGMAQKILVIPL